MSAATAAPRGVDYRSIAETFAPGAFSADPFGLVSGYKAYRIFTALSEKSDAQLAALGLSRNDIPRAAMRAADALYRK